MKGRGTCPVSVHEPLSDTFVESYRWGGGEVELFSATKVCSCPCWRKPL